MQPNTTSLLDVYNDKVDIIRQTDVIAGTMLCIFYGLAMIVTSVIIWRIHSSTITKSIESLNIVLGYFLVIVHYLDSITDQILLLEWYYWSLWLDPDENGITYWALLALCVGFLVIYRLTSGFFIYKYYNNNLKYFIFQLFDIGHCIELKQSYIQNNLTNNLRYLGMLTKTFETTPFLMLQLYVIFRTLPDSQIIPYPHFTFISVVTSSMSLFVELIVNNRSFYIKTNKLNIFCRIIFHIAELTATLMAISMVGAYFGLYFSLLFLLIIFTTNLMLYDKVLFYFISRNLNDSVCFF